MDNPVTIECGSRPTDFPTVPPSIDSPAASVLSGLLAVADRVLGLAADLLPAGTHPAGSSPFADPAEPEQFGLYRDRDGDIWQKTGQGWRLCLQRGIAVDIRTTWDWESGHVRDYGPFIPLTFN